ncbi:hypothetical protein Cs7R123_46540 [Catellatospora sp. TT07R-123]|nr:hypothetical protein Cs7R123_46540 [Catellatospora sp. TT07R-123]
MWDDRAGAVIGPVGKDDDSGAGDVGRGAGVTVGMGVCVLPGSGLPTEVTSRLSASMMICTFAENR